MNDVKTIILDMYGVILKDPEGGLMPYINGISPNLTANDVYPHWKKANVGDIASLDFFRNIGFRGDLEKIETDYLNTIEIDESFYPFALEMKKHYRLALLSNDLSEWSRYLRGKYLLNDFFDAIVVSGDVKMKKPDSQIFELLLRELNQPASACVYVDDRRKNLRAAQAVGMDAILYNSRKVPYDGKTVNNFSELANMLIPL